MREVLASGAAIAGDVADAGAAPVAADLTSNGRRNALAFHALPDLLQCVDESVEPRFVESVRLGLKFQQQSLAICGNVQDDGAAAAKINN
jgi:hypothetical protein